MILLIDVSGHDLLVLDIDIMHLFKAKFKPAVSYLQQRQILHFLIKSTKKNPYKIIKNRYPHLNNKIMFQK